MEHIYKNINGYLKDNNIILLDKVISKLELPAVWVELGSWTGKSAAYCIVELYNHKKLKEFHCVDTWNGSEGTNQKENSLVKEDKLFELFRENLLPIENLFTTHRMISWEAAKHFNNESVDFVYVDADHRYHSVIKDLEAWWPKIKTGCYIGGDDFTKGHPDVQKATTEFFKNRGLRVKKLGRGWIVKKN